MPEFIPSHDLVVSLNAIYLGTSDFENSAECRKAFGTYEKQSQNEQEDFCRSRISDALKVTMSEFYGRMRDMLIKESDIAFCLSSSMEGFEEGLLLQIMRELFGLSLRNALELSAQPQAERVNDFLFQMYDEYLEFCKTGDRINSIHSNIRVNKEGKLVITIPEF